MNTDHCANGRTAMRVTPLSSSCATALEQGEHACFGISPFNSYFSVERIGQLAAWGLEHFQRVDFFVPDAPSAFTLEALGYPPDRAAWKARRQGQYTRNRIATALRSLGTAAPEDRVLGWAELEHVPAFGRLHAAVLWNYAEDADFRNTCRETASWVLAGRLAQGRRPDDRQVDLAVRYFLAELPLFLDTPSIVGSGTSVFCYHQSPEVLTRLYDRKLVLHPAAGQGFGVVTPVEPAVTATAGTPPPSTATVP
ncbi:tRNA-dependent cyclodipeptide synthase [Streptomyces sp. MBT62]|uniref:tRNA-dependent cyclodipeptide synthase n=1 Tax=Streptomyces sp. MBT62 TaxID=2800410 RepID=UPI00190E4B00|nr:tRNA-dependent cyclodipeptide synthase [Streptomyces sp. MBT62]MBK3570965.1 tRNA-dependent cyclodipeptide synthase [Streptomyces sp. MBT62]